MVTSPDIGLGFESQRRTDVVRKNTNPHFPLSNNWVGIGHIIDVLRLSVIITIICYNYYCC